MCPQAGHVVDRDCLGQRQRVLAEGLHLLARVAGEGRRWQAMGLEAPTLVSDMTAAWWRVNRTPLVPGFLTESLDGAPVAPMMGSYPEHDVGTLRATMFPNFWMHGSGDHAVTTRLLPDGEGHTLVRVAWLVDARARNAAEQLAVALLQRGLAARAGAAR